MFKNWLQEAIQATKPLTSPFSPVLKPFYCLVMMQKSHCLEKNHTGSVTTRAKKHWPPMKCTVIHSKKVLAPCMLQVRALSIATLIPVLMRL